MRSIKMKLAALLICSGLHSLAQASVIDPVIYADSVTQLRWVSLRETLGLTPDDIDNGVGGWNQRYRLATADEVNRLLDGLGFVDTEYVQMDTQAYQGAARFIDLIAGGPVMSGTGSGAASGQTRGMSASAWISSGDETALSPSCPSYTSCIAAVRGFSAGGDGTGAFLVEVPEPSSMAMFGLGLAGALAVARRKRVNRAK